MLFRSTEFADGTVEAETLVTVTFEDLGARTRLTLRHEAFQSGTTSLNHSNSWTGALERLVQFTSAK